MPCFHRRYRCQGELSQRGVVLAVDTLALEDGELDGLLIIYLELVLLLLDSL
jgi:hypothetical protein